MPIRVATRGFLLMRPDRNPAPNAMRAVQSSLRQILYCLGNLIALTIVPAICELLILWKNLHASQIVAPIKRLRCNGLRVWQGLCFEFTDVVVPLNCVGGGVCFES